MKHLQTGRCSITILGLQDIAEIFFAILFFVCCLLQSYFYSKMASTDKGETCGFKKVTSFRPPVLSELSCLHQTTIHACIITTVYICVYFL